MGMACGRMNTGGLACKWGVRRASVCREMAGRNHVRVFARLWIGDPSLVQPELWFVSRCLSIS